MSCEYCQSLCVTQLIGSPQALCNAICLAAQYVRDGTLLEVPAEPDWNQSRFSECVKTMCWGDFVDYRFACNHCRQKFLPGAETYHGAGGSWRPVGEE